MGLGATSGTFGADRIYRASLALTHCSAHRVLCVAVILIFPRYVILLKPLGPDYIHRFLHLPVQIASGGVAYTCRSHCARLRRQLALEIFAKFAADSVVRRHLLVDELRHLGLHLSVSLLPLLDLLL